MTWIWGFSVGVLAATLWDRFKPRFLEKNRARQFRHFSQSQAKNVGKAIGISWPKSPFSIEQFMKGMNVELEHGRIDPETDVTGDDPIIIGKIAWAHLKERPDYYEKLREMEKHQ